MKRIRNIKIRGKSKLFFMIEILTALISIVYKKDSGTAENLLKPMNENFSSLLLSMYRGEPQMGMDGKKHNINYSTKLTPQQGMWIYGLCLDIKPSNTLEIGMAFGYSTLYFLAAIHENKLGHHIAIDPFEHKSFHGIGLSNVKSLSETNNDNFQFIEDRSDSVATDLVRSGSSFEVILIDGNHLFDNVFVDFHHYSQLCTIGGYIIFDDMWMRSVRTVVSYIENNRTDFSRVRTHESSFGVFQKVGEDSRKWDDFNWFSVSI